MSQPMTTNRLNIVHSILVIATLLTFVAGQSFLLTPLVGSLTSDGETTAAPKISNAGSFVINDQQECICTPFNLCQTYESSSDGEDYIDPRSNFGPCSSYLDVCCNDTKTTSTENYQSSSTEDGVNNQPNCLFQCVGKDEDANKELPTSLAPDTMVTSDDYTSPTPQEYTSESSSHSPTYQKCGVWNRNGLTFKVINAIDSEAQYSEYPSMVAIFKEKTSSDGEKTFEYHCGGSLIKPNVILTAAHCVIKLSPSALMVRAGDWDLKTEKEIYGHQDRKVSKIITHSQYSAGGLHNDIALIFTEEPYSLQENIQLMCLPEENEDFTYSLCYSSGWGKTVSYNNYTIIKQTESGKINEVGQYEVSILKKVDLPIIDRDVCLDALRGTRLGPRFMLHESFICAGGEEGKDTCKGDGGSPLMCPSKNDPDYLVQVGIVAWGIKCGLAKIPAVYVNVPAFRNWIDNEIIKQL